VSVPVDLDAIRAAHRRTQAVTLRTPLIPLPGRDHEIWLKLENLQAIGSFKIRGAANAILQLPPRELERGVLTASAGNMAQGVAYMARQAGVACTVVVPDSTPAAKVAAVENLGARVIRVGFDRWWQTFAERAYPGVDATFVHPFDDPAVMAGNGVIGLELLEDLPEVETVLIPWGGGGLATGIATAVRALRPQARIYAVEVETAAPLAASLAAGSVATVEMRPSFVDGIGSKTVFPQMLDHARRLLDGSLTASPDEVRHALRLIVERAHAVPEGAGAVAAAVALSGRAGSGSIACIVSGGSIGAGELAELLGPS
jgi:threonine dehydratase